MEKALERRVELEIKRGTRRATAESDAEKFLETFTSEFRHEGDPTVADSRHPEPMLKQPAHKPPKPSDELAERVHPTTREPASDSEKAPSTGFFADMGMDFSGEAYEHYDEDTASDSDGSPSERSDERSEEHTSELQSRGHLVCRLLLEKKTKTQKNN